MSNNESIQRSPDRVAILEKIAEYEKERLFDRDVENDPPTVPLDYTKVDYAGKKPGTRFRAFFANIVAKGFYEKKIRRGELIIKEVRGIENYRSVKGGAILSCNHFSVCDNYAVYKSIEKDLGRRRLYKVIREGNYTSFGGLYGYFFRNCNTLPLTSSLKGMGVMMRGVAELLERGEKILIYPEQGMWWNYRKPRPLKDGGFMMAYKNSVPVIPFFITMEDSDKLGEDGFPIQAYTVNILPPIYPDTSLDRRAGVAAMRDENYRAWKEVYENFYGIELTY